MSVICFVVGGPASGKTTLVSSFFTWKNMMLIDKPKVTISKDVCAAGHYTGTKFDGADTIPYNQDLKTAQYMAKKRFFKCEYVFLDGDRMSNRRVKGFLTRFEPVCVYIDIDLDTHLIRAAKRKSNQNLTWVKGRLTKSRNFYDKFDENKRLRIDGNLSVGEIKSAAETFIRGINGATHQA